MKKIICLSALLFMTSFVYSKGLEGQWLYNINNSVNYYGCEFFEDGTCRVFSPCIEDYYEWCYIDNLLTIGEFTYLVTNVGDILFLVPLEYLDYYSIVMERIE